MGKTYEAYRADIVCHSQSTPNGKDKIESLTWPMRDHRNVFFHTCLGQLALHPRAWEQTLPPAPKARGC